MGSRQVYAIEGMIFAFFDTCSGVSHCDWWRIYFKKEVIFLLPSHKIDKAISAITTKQYNCPASVLTMNLQYVAARSAFQIFAEDFIIHFPCMDIDTLLSRAIHSAIIDIFKKNLNWIFSLFKNIYPSSQFRKNEFIFLLRYFCSPDTWTCIEDKNSQFRWDTGSSSVHAKYIRTHCLLTLHVPHIFKNAIVIPIIGGECAKYPKCSQLFKIDCNLKSTFVEVMRFAMLEIDTYIT